MKVRGVMKTALVRVTLFMTTIVAFLIFNNYSIKNISTTSTINSNSTTPPITNKSIPILPSLISTKLNKTAKITNVTKRGNKQSNLELTPKKTIKRTKIMKKSKNPYKSQHKIKLTDDDGTDSLADALITKMKILLMGEKQDFEDLVNKDTKHNSKTKKQTHKTGATIHTTNSTLNSNHTNQRNMNSELIKIAKIPTLSSKLKECDIRVKLSPCECERDIKARLPVCPVRNTSQQDIVAYINKTLGESTCSTWATLRGGNQLVISYSLFGVFPSDYFRGIVKQAQAIQNKYPHWSVRIYHDLDFNRPNHKDWLCNLSCTYPQLDFCSVDNLPGGLGDIRWSLGTVWRLGVMGDRLVTRFMIRDTDSPILQRELDAVEEWLQSGKCFHIMRDTPAHDQGIMAGVWGGCGWWHKEAMPRLRDRVIRWSPQATSPLSRDQINVVQLLWPTVKKNHIAHDSYWCSHFPNSQPFPSRRQNGTFVGMRSYRQHYQDDQVNKPCPLQCRPKKHQDWIYC